MSEPLPEAKQAAEAKGYRQDKGYEYGAFVEGYDTATAKAREEFVKTQELVLQRDSEIAQLKWKMQEVDKALWDEAKPKGYEPDRAEAIRAVRKLAHQPLDSAASTSSGQARDKQPSAHAGDCTIYRSTVNGRPVDGICTCGYGWKKVREGDWSQMYSKEHQQPSAPTAETERKEGDESCQADFTSTALSSVAPKGSTPAAATTADMEKIAREKEAVDFCEKQGLRAAFIAEDLRRAMLTVAAQARAPLVEALERVKARVPLPSPYYEMVQDALTGTEISRVKEGEVTTK